MEEIKISVRRLVEFILRSGDIDNRFGQGVSIEAMREGSRIHRKIQRQMGSDYSAEVPLKIEFRKEDYTLVIEGRADGIMIKDDKVTIDEIKGMYLELSFLDEPIEIHMAQAMCYAYIYGIQHDKKEMDVQMTYCNLDTEEIKRFVKSFSMEELADWFLKLKSDYEKWADFQYEMKVKRQDSIKKLEFPFPYRDGQRELAASVYRTINRGKTLFIQAPTGTGKTISTVFPAVKAVGEGLCDKIFYLTAKTITRTVAKEAFDLLKERGYSGSVLIITAKEKLCVCDEVDCNPIHCPNAKGHYDRVNDAVFELINRTKDLTREEIIKQAQDYMVCPYELCLDASLWADNIICDYNYLFDPNVYLRRYFGEGINGEYIFLVDEAHNLVERGREMYSAVLYKESFLEMKHIFQKYSIKITKTLEICNKYLLAQKKECFGYRVLNEVSDLLFSLMNLMAQMDEFFQKDVEMDEKKEVREFYLTVRHFINMYDRLDENYVIYTEQESSNRFKIKLYCVNPSANLQECLNRGISTVFFSATLLPIQYYKSLLSTNGDNYAVYATSVFSEEQQLLLIGNDVSSKYTRRTQQEFMRIAKYIHSTALARKGNYIAFFPSYQLMRQVYDIFETLNEDQEMDCLLQESGMNEQEREVFLEEFVKQRQNTMVGFCVLGGVFSEGIDLKEEQLIGALIVGTGLPQISNEREILKQYYDAREESGFDYAFRYPGMNKVLQAAGRVIRTSGDKGVIVLLDERFLQPSYRNIFPREWQNYSVCNEKTAGGVMEQFWNG